MGINANEYKSRVGLDSLFVAEVTQDDSAGYAAETPVYFAPVAEASAAPSNSSETQFADDKPFDVMTSEGVTKLNISITALPLEMQAKILGKRFDPTTGRMYDNNGTPPYIALSFRSKKSNGGYRYYQILKGKFETPSEDFSTNGDKPEPKVTKLVFTAIQTTYEFSLGGGIVASAKQVVGDTDTDAFDATGWFSQVQVPSVGSPSALALSSSTPADGASGVSVSADLTLTFNNALQAAAVYGVALFKASDGSLTTALVTLDTTKKIITINPSASLTASTAYLLTYAVTDIYGQVLQGAVNFTTA